MNPLALLDLAELRRHVAPGGRLLLAVSGGPDSCAMLHAMHAIASTVPFAIEVVHVNHMARGDASMEDARFVEQLCASLGVPCHYRETAPPSERPRGETLEEYFRRQRHAALIAAVRDCAAAAVVLGHTANDMAESLLMHLLRGAGLHGLAFPCADRHEGLLFIRPLWRTERATILQFLQENNIAYRIDATNESTEPTRNRIRHVLMPLLEKEFNPSVSQALVRAATALTGAQEVLHAAARAHIAGLRPAPPTELPMEGFYELPAAVRAEVLRQWLAAASPDGVPAAVLESLAARPCHGAAGRYSVPGGRLVVRAGQSLLLLSPEPEDRTADIAAVGRELTARFHAANPDVILARLDEPIAIPTDKLAEGWTVTCAAWDGTELKLHLSLDPQGDVRALPGAGAPVCLLLRHRMAGDRVSDSVKLKKWLVQDKVPALVRRHLLLIADEANRVYAVAGMKRINARLAKANPLSAALRIARL